MQPEMMNVLVNFVTTLMMYTITGTVVGVGVALSQDFPQIGAFLKRRPIIGWTLAFALGSTTVTVLWTLIEFAVLAFVNHFVR